MADRRHAAYCSAYRGSGAPPWVSRPSLGGGGVFPGPRGWGLRGRRPPGRPPALRGSGGEGGGGEGGGLPTVPLCSPGAAPRWLPGGSLVVSDPGGKPLTGGAHSPPAPLHPPGPRLSCGPSPPGPPAPPAAVASPRSTGWGGGEGPAGALGGGPVQRLVIGGLRVSGVSAPRASARSWLPPSPLLGAARVPPLRERRGGGGEGALGRGARSCCGGCPAGPSEAPCAHCLGPLLPGAPVTCAATCVGVGAAPAAGSSGGSASG